MIFSLLLEGHSNHLHHKGAFSLASVVIWEGQIFGRTPVQWQKEEIDIWWDLVLSALHLKLSLSREGRRNTANLQVNAKGPYFSLSSFVSGQNYSLYVSFVLVLKLPMCSSFRAVPICLTWLSMEFDRTKKTFYDEIT